jgi:hypothetical protein
MGLDLENFEQIFCVTSSAGRSSDSWSSRGLRYQGLIGAQAIPCGVTPCRVADLPPSTEPGLLEARVGVSIMTGGARAISPGLQLECAR